MRVDARNVCVDGLRGIRIKIHVCRLTGFDLADLPLGNKTSQVHLAEVQQSDDRGSGRNHLSRLCHARDHRSVKGRLHGQILAIFPRLSELRLGLTNRRHRVGNRCLLLRKLHVHSGYAALGTGHSSRLLVRG